jgi:soluble lytic murein transglycosylase-like protein
MRWQLTVVALLSSISLNAMANCWQQAGERYGIDPLLLVAIGEQETGLRNNVVNYNNDGSYDIGLMQINSTHLPRLAKKGIRKSSLLKDSCVSVMVGASILSGFIKQMGGTWEAVGAYNAGASPKRHSKRVKYAVQVWRRYQRLIWNQTMLGMQSRPGPDNG